MRAYRFLILIVIALLLCAGCGNNSLAVKSSGEAYEVVDDEGTVVKLKAKPQRILTTHFHLDTMLLGIVPQDRIVALTTTMDDANVSYADPKDIEKPKRFKYNFTMEQVLEYKPDLIIARPYSQNKIRTYRDMGIPVYVSKMPLTIKEIEKSITGIAKVCGEPQRGKILNDKIEKFVSEIADKIPKEKHYTKSVVLVSKMNPNYGGKGCFWDDACKVAKLRNGIADIGIDNGYHIGKEILVKANPDYFVLSKAWEINHGFGASYRDEFKNDPALKNLKAVKENRVMYLKDKYLYAANQNCVYAVKYLANMAYGDIFPQEKEALLKGY